MATDARGPYHTTASRVSGRERASSNTRARALALHAHTHTHTNTRTRTRSNKQKINTVSQCPVNVVLFGTCRLQRNDNVLLIIFFTPIEAGIK